MKNEFKVVTQNTFHWWRAETPAPIIMGSVNEPAKGGRLPRYGSKLLSKIVVCLGLVESQNMFWDFTVVPKRVLGLQLTSQLNSSAPDTIAGQSP